MKLSVHKTEKIVWCLLLFSGNEKKKTLYIFPNFKENSFAATLKETKTFLDSETRNFPSCGLTSRALFFMFDNFFPSMKDNFSHRINGFNNSLNTCVLQSQLFNQYFNFKSRIKNYYMGSGSSQKRSAAQILYIINSNCVIVYTP